MKAADSRHGSLGPEAVALDPLLRLLAAIMERILRSPFLLAARMAGSAAEAGSGNYPPVATTTQQALCLARKSTFAIILLNQCAIDTGRAFNPFSRRRASIGSPSKFRTFMGNFLSHRGAPRETRSAVDHGPRQIVGLADCRRAPARFLSLSRKTENLV
jgi:hypothetical protein